MTRPQTWWAVIVGLVLALGPASPAISQAVPHSSIGKDLKQCHNGPSGQGPCTTNAHGSDPGWDNGTINQSNGLYRMGDFVPFRAVLTGLTVGTNYSLRIGYRAVHNGYHSYDYLGSYDGRNLVQQVVPCGGLDVPARPHACGIGPTPGPSSRTAVPPDMATTFPGGGHPSGTGSFAAWGADLTVATFHACPDCGAIGVNTTGTVHRQIDVAFHAQDATVVIAWGGHVASALDWGFARTYAESGSGASGFQMYLLRVHQQSGPNYSTGTVSRNMNVNATGLEVGIATEVTFTPNPPTTVLVGQSVTDTARLSATGSPPKPVTGRVHFFVCGPTPGPVNCNQGGTDLGSREVERASQGSANGVASIGFIPRAAGTFCFRVEFVPNPTGYYSPHSHVTTTNECFFAVEARIRVTKLCSPANDSGRFNLFVNGAPLGAPDVTCGGSRPATGYLDTTAGDHLITETAGSGTNLDDYTTSYGGNCAGGLLRVALGATATCVITNTVNDSPPPGSLTLIKRCVPAEDPGRFEIRIDGVPVADLACGQSTTAPVHVAPGAHTITEVGVSPTNVGDYTTEISAPCAGGSVTLAPGQPVTCTITNTRVTAPTTTLRVDKACVPAGDRGRFNLTINGNVAGTGANVNCLGTTGAVPVAPGTYTVGETAAGSTHLANYKTQIGGDCAANGTITVAAGQQATCLITNIRPAPRPPPFCYVLDVPRRMVTTGPRVRIVARVHLGGRPVQGVHVFAVGPGVSAVRLTGRTGLAVFVLSLRRPGILTLRIRQPFDCPKPLPRRVGILGVRQPVLTG